MFDSLHSGTNPELPENIEVATMKNTGGAARLLLSCESEGSIMLLCQLQYIQLVHSNMNKDLVEKHLCVIKVATMKFLLCKEKPSHATTESTSAKMDGTQR